MKPIEIIKNFAEKGFTKEGLEKELYYNNDLIIFLEKYKNIPHNQVVSAYHYIIEKNFDDKDSFLNIMNVFNVILHQENINFKPNLIFEKEYNFISDVTPLWLPKHIGYINKLYDENKPITKKNFKELLLQHFKYINKPPKWLQEADWIINTKPLIFIGQFDVSSLYHDRTYLYIFFNSYESKYEYITQSM